MPHLIQRSSPSLWTPPLAAYDWLLIDNADRLYPWADYCGIPGGIPNRTTIYTSLGVAGQAPTYAQSVTAAQVNAEIGRASCRERV